eukprot:3567139-Amphidinium_carterae.1
MAVYMWWRIQVLVHSMAQLFGTSTVLHHPLRALECPLGQALLGKSQCRQVTCRTRTLDVQKVTSCDGFPGKKLHALSLGPGQGEPLERTSALRDRVLGLHLLLMVHPLYSRLSSSCNIVCKPSWMQGSAVCRRELTGEQQSTNSGEK